MSILKLAWASGVLGALLLGGCMMDATGSDDDGALGEDELQLVDGPGVPAPGQALATDEDEAPGPLALGAAVNEQAPMPGDLVANDDDPNEPHPDPWRVAPASGPDPSKSLGGASDP